MPLSSLGADASIAVADALMARSLRAKGQLLWAVDPSLPELPGSAPPALPPALDGARCAEICAPGAYRSVCAELSVNHLTICAISQASNAVAAAWTRGRGQVGQHATAGPYARNCRPLLALYGTRCAEICAHGMHQSLCAELSVNHFAICAISQVRGLTKMPACMQACQAASIAGTTRVGDAHLGP